jgi:hypothetical protein
MTATISQKLAPLETNQRRINTAINKIIEGRTDNYGSVTLTASTAQTVITPSGAQISENSAVFLTPRTANAAAAISTTYVSAVANGTFTLSHASNAQTDRTFDYAWIG